MKIEVWSDVVCPWCFIGKRRLESALTEFTNRHGTQARPEVVWRSFQLDPGAPSESNETTAEHLGRKYGGGAEAGRAMIAQVQQTAAGEGMTWRLAEAFFVNTLDAHRLLHLALSEGGPGRQSALKEALLAAYFERAENVGDHRVLADLAAGIGLDPDRVRQVLAGTEFRDAALADQQQAVAYGANGVPFYVVDGRYGLSGAQPVEVFSEVLEKAWSDAQPKLDLLSSAEGVCGPDGCELPSR